MPRHPTPLPPSLEYPVFTATEAVRHGVTRDRLNASDLIAIARGLYGQRDELHTEVDILSAYCRADPKVFAHGLSAARYWGLPLPQNLQTALAPAKPSTYPLDRPPVTKSASPTNALPAEISDAAPPPDRRLHLAAPDRRRTSNALVRWGEHRREDEDIVAIGDLRLTTHTRTLVDLAAVLRRDLLVQIGDHLVRRPRSWAEKRRSPYATLGQLRDLASASSGRGARTLREAVELMRVGSDSPAETRLRLALVRAGLPEPLANVRAYEGTMDLGEPDLHWPQWRVALEHEGPGHLDRRQLAKDIRRGDLRRDHGWIEVRTTAGDLRDGCWEAVCRVAVALRRQGWRGEVHQISHG